MSNYILFCNDNPNDNWQNQFYDKILRLTTDDNLCVIYVNYQFFFNKNIVKNLDDKISEALEI